MLCHKVVQFQVAQVYFKALTRKCTLSYSLHYNEYDLKNVILLKHRMHQRTETRVCKCFVRLVRKCGDIKQR